MKKLKTILLISCFILIYGCQKDKDTPTPTPVPVPTPTPTPITYSKFNITQVIVTNMPFYNLSGYTWDTSSDPDIYFTISNSTTILFSGLSSYKTNVSSANLPTGWTFSTPYVISSLSTPFDVDLWDNDTNDFPSNADDYMSFVTFTMSSYISTYPTTVYASSGYLSITLKGTWSN